MPTPNSAEEPLVNPIWAVRGLPGLATILVGLAQFVLKASPLHDMCLGGALGLLISSVVFSFSVKTVVLKDKPQPADVDRYSLS
jgi:hypothetical protein